MKIIKKIFNRTSIFILLIIINAICFFILSKKLEKSNNSSLPEYQNIGDLTNDSFVLADKKMYTVTKKNLNKYYSYYAVMDVISEEEMYCSYYVDELFELKIGQVVLAGHQFGKLEEEVVACKNKGRIMNIVEDKSSYEIIVLNSNNFIVRAFVSQYDFYTEDFSSQKNKNYFILSDKTKIPINYLGVDYHYAVQDGNLVLEYEVIDEDCLIIPGVTGALHIEYETLKDVFVIPREAFSDINNINERTYIYSEPDTRAYDYIEILALEYVGNEVIIEAKSDKLSDGLRIYEIIK